MSKIMIEHGIPIPPRHKYPFAQMKSGDSFFIETSPEDRRRTLKLCSAAASYHLPRKFTFRTIENGIRVWCIEAPAEAPSEAAE
jgi:hypothetical protein